MTAPGPGAHLLVTGGAGFVGSCFVRDVLGRRDGTRITVLDKLTYAGNRANLDDVEADAEMSARFTFVRGDIADPSAVAPLAAAADAVVNFAAESHVDRSILEPAAFLRTGVDGVHVLLEALRGETDRVHRGERATNPAPPAGLHRRGLRVDRRGTRGRVGRPGAALAVRRGEGRGRAARAGVPRDLRARRRDHPGLEHLRSLPPPREADPALRDERPRRPAPAALRRRPAAARLALRRRPRGRHRPRPGARCGGRGLQHPGIGRAHEPRPGGPAPRPARQALVARPVRGRPARPRPALRDGRLEARGARLGEPGRASTRAWRRPSTGTVANEAVVARRRGRRLGRLLRPPVRRRGWPRSPAAEPAG